MLKKYNNAELQIVRLNKNDIIVTSPVGIGEDYATGIFDADAPGIRDFNDWGHVY